MKYKTRLFAVLLAALLLCGCTRLAEVPDADAAAEQLAEVLQEFSHGSREDYDCVLLETVTEEGKTVYRLEGFWKNGTERYSVGVFRVSEDGTVEPEE